MGQCLRTGGIPWNPPHCRQHPHPAQSATRPISDRQLNYADDLREKGGIQHQREVRLRGERPSSTPCVTTTSRSWKCAIPAPRSEPHGLHQAPAQFRPAGMVGKVRRGCRPRSSPANSHDRSSGFPPVRRSVPPALRTSHRSATARPSSRSGAAHHPHGENGGAAAWSSSAAPMACSGCARDMLEPSWATRPPSRSPANALVPPPPARTRWHPKRR